MGLGNLILTDDGIGITIARKIKDRNPLLEVIETSEAGIALLDFMVGYDRIILIDSIITGKGNPGELYKFELKDLKLSMNLSSAHGVDIATVFETGKKLGFKMPTHVSIYAIEITDNTTFGEKCTRAVEEKIPFITKEIIKEEKL